MSKNIVSFLFSPFRFANLSMSRKVTWNTYDQGQLGLLPPSYDELLPQNHPVRIVNTILDSVDLSSLEQSYRGG